MLKIMYLGDIMGKPGRAVVASQLPNLRKKYKPDLVIAQSENVSHGSGMSPNHMRQLQEAGVDFFSGGNHSLGKPALFSYLANVEEPVVAPINMPGVEAAWGAKTVQTARGKVLVVSLLGATFPSLAEDFKNPLHAIDQVLADFKKDYVVCVVNFHGDFSSEKRVIGYYLDGRASLVVGDHWYVATADAMVLPGGTAHVTDVGMCGTLHSSLGVSKEIIIDRWRNGIENKNQMHEEGPYQLNAVMAEISEETGLAQSVKPINIVVKDL
ncbi:MAG: TIGR00282 family metallophosphoesterase [Candidatus Woesebacteria bacterium]|jgi:metallophosphoesterase (TIGR00282 family)